MRFYEEVYFALRLPEVAKKVARGDIRLIPTANTPFISEGFPPALVPIWSNDFGYYGFWKHWFCERSISIVSIDFGDHFMAIEVARSFEQFSVLVTAQMLCAGVFDEDESLQILLDLGLQEIDFIEMLQIAQKSGDNPLGMRFHRRFVEDPPLACFVNPAEYRGDFPIVEQNSSQLPDNCCGFELSLDTLQDSTRTKRHSWLNPVGGWWEQRPLFESCLAQNDLKGAWMSLNSPAWTADDARKAIQQLAEKAGDPQFAILASAWIAERQGILA